MFGIRVLRYILKFVSVILIVAFVALNRQETRLYISPLTDPLELPIWLMGLVIFAFGFIVGALLLWLNSWPIRKELRQTKKALAQSEKDQTELSETLQANSINTIEDQTV